jgi:hypothetical protein
MVRGEIESVQAGVGGHRCKRSRGHGLVDRGPGCYASARRLNYLESNANYLHFHGNDHNGGDDHTAVDAGGNAAGHGHAS